MPCKKPYMLGVMPCDCGNCLPCTITRRRVWSTRIMLESFLHEHNTFITLTYAEEKVPVDGSVSKRDVQLFLKRLRKRVAGRLSEGGVASNKIRYYMVGEYGETTGRPHYHGAMFGLPTCERLRTEHRVKSCCGPCETVGAAWGLGGVDLGELNQLTAQYVAGYITKRIPLKERELWQRQKEFALMSRRPEGIGASAMAKVRDALIVYDRCTIGGGRLDVPSVIRVSGKLLPLGRYLRRKIRELQSGSQETPREAIEKYGEELRALYGAALEDPESSKGVKTWSEFSAKLNGQKILNIESKFKVFEKKGSI